MTEETYTHVFDHKELFDAFGQVMQLAPRDLARIVRNEIATPTAAAALITLTNKALEPQLINYAEYLQSDGWKERRQRKLEQAGHRCQRCESRSRLHVHHLTYQRLGKEHPDDLMVLCHRCHAAEHGKPA